VHRLFAATAYRNVLAKKVIRALKYRYDRSLASPLALRTLTALHGGRVPPPPLFVPVPLHRSRERWRGFNQAALLAQAAADAGLFSYAEPLKRTVNTAPQTKAPGRTERLHAMSGAFSVTDRKSIKDRHIILVDDVCTTGATLNACAQALLKGGARSITALVIARV
jgi:ComF family protein